jgi:hypothetical protein
MSLMDLIRRDVEQILSDTDTGYAVEITFTPPAGDPVTIAGTATKHHLGLDRQGAPANVKTASCTVSEKTLSDAGYTVRNGAGLVSLTRHKVSWKDANDTEITYSIQETYPDELLGVIVCVLGDFR